MIARRKSDANRHVLLNKKKLTENYLSSSICLAFNN